MLDVEEARGAAGQAQKLSKKVKLQLASGLGRVLHLRGGRPDQCRRLGVFSTVFSISGVTTLSFWTSQEELECVARLTAKRVASPSILVESFLP